MEKNKTWDRLYSFSLCFGENADFIYHVSCVFFKREGKLTLVRKPDFFFLGSLALEASRPCVDLAGVVAGVVGAEGAPLVAVTGAAVFVGVPGTSLATGAGVASPGAMSFLTGAGAS